MLVHVRGKGEGEGRKGAEVQIMLMEDIPGTTPTRVLAWVASSLSFSSEEAPSLSLKRTAIEKFVSCCAVVIYIHLCI